MTNPFPLRSLCLLLLGLGTLCSCHKEPAQEPASPQQSASNQAAQTQPTQTPGVPAVESNTPAPKAAITLTPQQIGSVLRVRTVLGGLPPLETTGALIHHDDIPVKTLAEGNVRYAVTLLKGFTAAQLCSSSAHFFIMRNKANSNAEFRAMAVRANLVNYDEKSGIALLGFFEDFDYSLDTGFHPAVNDPAHTDLRLVRATQAAGDSEALWRVISGQNWVPGHWVERQSAPPFGVDAGSYQGSRGEAKMEMPAVPDGMAADHAFLALDAAGGLVGFVPDMPGGKVTVTPMGQFFAILRAPTVRFVKTVFEADNVRARLLLFEDTDGDNVRPEQIWLCKSSLEQPPEIDEKALPDSAGSFAKIPGEFTVLQRATMDSFYTTLPLPPTGTESVYRMQVAWAISPGKNAPLVYGRPFVVRLTRKASGLYPTVTGLIPSENAPAEDNPSATGTPSAPSGPLKFPLEAAARGVHMVAGGRGALIEFRGAPYWKLFSFEKNDWLPLPGNLENTSITGNLDSIFILDFNAKEIRKFKFSDLSPAGTKRLPPGNYAAILAGCNSAYAPVSIVTDSATMLKFEPAGLTQEAPPPPGSSTAMGGRPGDEDFFSYTVSGDGLEFSSKNGPGFGKRLLGITGGFELDNGLKCSDMPAGQNFPALPEPRVPWNRSFSVALAENAPVLFLIARPREQEVPPKPPRVGCFSFFSPVPFAEMDVPEMAEIEAGVTSTLHQRWVFLDPYSKQIATLSADRKTWWVRKLLVAETAGQPALLNWPDTSVPRDGRLNFQAIAVGMEKITAEFPDKPRLAATDSTGKVEIPVPQDDINAQSHLILKIQGKGKEEFFYPVLIHNVVLVARASATDSPATATTASSAPMPLAVLPSVNIEGLNNPSATPQSLGMSGGDVCPLQATLKNLDDPVNAIPGVVNDCALLVTDASRMDFLSLKTGSVSGSAAMPKGAYFYPGAGALFEYDPAKRTLTRISVPKGEREQVLEIPANIDLCGIGLGTEPGSPITLAVGVRPRDKGALYFSDLRISGTSPHSAFAVLDSRTLRAGTQAQPMLLSEFLGKKETGIDPVYSFLGSKDKPSTLPASHNGSVINLPRHFLAVGPTYAVVYPCDRGQPGMDLCNPDFSLAGGSITGLMAFDNRGNAFKGETSIGGGSSQYGFGATPCGRYRMRWVDLAIGGVANGYGYAEIVETDTSRPLLHLARLASLNGNQFSPLLHTRVVMLGDEGPLAVVDPSGRMIQLVKLDIPGITKLLSSTEFHVVSQPIPLVMEGRNMQYQVKVNNPLAVDSYRLQKETPGMSISPSGLFTCQAPATIPGPVRIVASIEIKGKDGKIVLHEFPIYVLPAPRAGKSKIGEI